MSKDAEVTAGAVLGDYLREQAARLRELDPEVRADAPDAVHQARVTTRRLRAALAAYRPLLERERTEPLREELRWLGRALGGARDAEVCRDRFASVLDALPDELILDGVREDLVGGAEAAMQEERVRVAAALDGERYRDLLESLDRLAEDPPLGERASRPAARELRRLAAKEWERASRLHAQALHAPAVARDEAMHEARKAARRARYGAEVAAVVLGGPAARLAKRLKAVQGELGDRHDAMELAGLLRRDAVGAHAEGRSTLTYGVMIQIELDRAARADASHGHTWSRAVKAGRRLARLP
ncbi:CHAD domain-containing protein [Demequina pelophila]|uniref:CHAD domain-containing protein n=1 Tax=Demequina pelophila TaxID=1638984 RepID=UPI00078544FA|nr:CHAD domain-containing protein [Demequina pelophila]